MGLLSSNATFSLTAFVTLHQILTRPIASWSFVPQEPELTCEPTPREKIIGLDVSLGFFGAVHAALTRLPVRSLWAHSRPDGARDFPVTRRLYAQSAHYGAGFHQRPMALRQLHDHRYGLGPITRAYE